MSRRVVGFLWIVSLACSGLAGCATTFRGDSSNPFRKGEQKEPEFTDEDDKVTSNWQKETAQMRGGKQRKAGRDGWLDNLLWSSESQDIARSLNADL